MGCTTCKEKNQNNNENGSVDTINLIPDSIANGDFSGNFFFKLITFFVITIAIPFIILVLVVQLFLTFFLPKSLPKVSKKFKAFLMSGFTIYASFKLKREAKKRKRQFEKNQGYEEGSELIDIEDYTDINVHEDNNEKE
jgi:predicted membrane protein|tara:strand:- start:753 stop:1169 length:417 start_codon:yes stop_codon:yes gene_type:complete